MNNSTINNKIILILLGTMFGAFWIYCMITIPDMLTINMTILEQLGAILLIIMPFISAGLIIAGLLKDDVLGSENDK